MFASYFEKHHASFFPKAISFTLFTSSGRSKQQLIQYALDTVFY